MINLIVTMGHTKKDIEVCGRECLIEQKKEHTLWQVWVLAKHWYVTETVAI